MKRAICSLLICCCVHAAVAQDTLKIRPEQEQQEPSPQEIDIRELPEIIKHKLSSDQYSSWILRAAYSVADVDSATNDKDSIDYIVELKKGDEVIRVRFDDAGNRRNERQE